MLSRPVAPVAGWRDLVAGGLACFSVIGLALADGGFYPRAWGIATALLAAIAIVAQHRPVGFGRGDWMLLGGIGALVGWMAIALVWTESTTASMPELERALVYLAAVGAALFVTTRDSAGTLLSGVVAGAATVSGWALLDYLVLANRRIEPFEGALLTGTLGYANALGGLASIAAVAAVGIAAVRAGRVSGAVAVATAVVLVAASVLTESRGAALAGLAGVVALIVVAGPRVLLVTSLVGLASAAVAVATWSTELLDGDVATAEVRWQGRALALVIAAAALAAGVLSFSLPGLERLLERLLARALRVAVPVVLAGFVLVVGAVLVSGRALATGDRPDYWGAAWRQHEQHRLLGAGPGTFERAWLVERSEPKEVRDAHSLYVETLGELGLVGAALVIVALGSPLLLVRRGARGTAAAAAGAYVTFLVHAGLDWDWEMPAVTVAGLLCAAALAVNAREPAERTLAPRVRAVVAGCGAAVVLLASVALAGNWRLTSARDALASGRPELALVEADRAAGLQPWSGMPRIVAGQAAFALGDVDEAARNLRAAAARDPGNWLAWWLLSRAANGNERALALARALALNPLLERSGAPAG